MTNIAIFPLPGAVAFPGQTLPLHIFEPRYRQMIRDCVAQDRYLGVALAGDTIAEPRHEPGSKEEELKRNQSTYRPKSIFSAGPVEILQELADERLVIAVHLRERYELQDITQTLPYFIGRAHAMPASLHRPEELSHHMQRIRNGLDLLLKDEPQKVNELVSNIYGGDDDEQKLGQLLQVIQLPADTQQRLLECDDLSLRASRLAKMLELHLMSEGLLDRPGTAGASHESATEEPGKVIPLFPDSHPEPTR